LPSGLSAELCHIANEDCFVELVSCYPSGGRTFVRREQYKFFELLMPFIYRTGENKEVVVGETDGGAFASSNATGTNFSVARSSVVSTPDGNNASATATNDDGTS